MPANNIKTVVYIFFAFAYSFGAVGLLEFICFVGSGFNQGCTIQIYTIHRAEIILPLVLLILAWHFSSKKMIKLLSKSNNRT